MADAEAVQLLPAAGPVRLECRICGMSAEVRTRCFMGV
jgi:hypothetical protein